MAGRTPTKSGTGGSAQPEIVLDGLWGWLSRNLGIQPWGQALIVVLLGLLGLGWWFVFSLENRLASIDAKLADLPSDISNETDAKIEKMRGDLIEQFFTKAKQYSEAKQFRDAAASLTAASILLQTARQYLVEPKDRNFFQNAVYDLNFVAEHSSSALVSVTHAPLYNAQRALASYRSALEISRLPKPLQEPGAFKKLSPPEIAKLLGVLSGFTSGGNQHKDIIDSPGASFTDLYFTDGQQTLDTYEWNDVIFINMHIIYRGGPLQLHRVLFINCTFDTVPTATGSRFLDYAALNQSDISIS